jgi:hypothetical protein
LLSTSLRGDAVTIGYPERASPERGLSPLGSRLLPGARIPAFAGMTIHFHIKLFTVPRQFEPSSTTNILIAVFQKHQ